MNRKPKLFIGSASESIGIARALENELINVVATEVWDQAFRAGHYTLEELTLKASEVDFAVFILGQDDKTESREKLAPSPRDNVVYEAGLFAGQLGVPNVFLLVDLRGTKIPTDWQGLGYLVFDPTAGKPTDIVHPAAVKIRQLITDWTVDRKITFEEKISGYWWQYVVNSDQGSSFCLFHIYHPSGCRQLQIKGQAWTCDGKKNAVFWSRALAVDDRDRKLFYYWEGKHPFDKNIPMFFGVGELNFADTSSDDIVKADGWYSETPLIQLDATVRKSSVYLRASVEDVRIVEGMDPGAIEKLMINRMEEWKKLSI